MKKKRILLTWELGEGLGHIRPLGFLGHQLIDAGFELVFACRNPVLGAQEIHPDIGRVVAAPYQPHPRLYLGAVRNYASILQIQGYAEENELMAMVRSWRDLIETIQPGLIIADHSPTAILAARGICPVIQTGTGFTVPPCHTKRFPDLDWNDEALLAPAADGHILKITNRVLSQFGAPTLEHLPQMMDTEGRCIFAIEDFDPYRKYRQEMTFGPMEPKPNLNLYPADLDIFSYISSDYSKFDILMQTLHNTEFDATYFVRGLDERERLIFESKGVSVLAKAPHLTEILPQCGLVLHHGGLSTTQSALFAGRPQIILPQHNEARTTAKVAEALGVAKIVEENDLQKLPDILRSYLHDRSWREKALEVGRQFQSKDFEDPVKGVLSAAIQSLS